MRSTTGSRPCRLSPSAGQRSSRMAPRAIGAALDRLEPWRRIRRRARLSEDEPEKHGFDSRSEPGDADIVVVLGGDGTMLRALQRLPRQRRSGHRRQLRPRRLPHLDRSEDELEPACRASSPATTSVVELPTLEARAGGERRVAGQRRRRHELDARPHGRARVGGRRRGPRHAAAATASSARRRPARPPTTSRTAGRCSSGASTRWRSRSSRRTRSTRGRSSSRADSDVVVTNRTRGRARVRARRTATFAEVAPGGRVDRPARRERSLLATLPEATFFRRYRDTFGRRSVSRVLRRLRIENLVLIREAELELAPGLNAITGETGAGKTILAQAIGLLLGAKGDAAASGPARPRPTSRPSSTCPTGCSTRTGSRRSPSCGPEDEDGLVLARRVFADGRTRAYAWGRSGGPRGRGRGGERLIAMSGQFEQRRLARPAYQLDVLDAFAGDEQLRARASCGAAWRALGAARRRHDELSATRPPRRRGSRSCARSSRTRTASSPTTRTRCAPSASGSATSPSWPRARPRRQRRSHRTRARAPPASSAARSGRSRRSSGSRPSSRAPATSCATSRSACARRRATCARSSTRSRPSPARLEQVEERARRDRRRAPPLPLRRPYDELLERAAEARARAGRARGRASTRPPPRPQRAADAEERAATLAAALRGARGGRAAVRRRRRRPSSGRRPGRGRVRGELREPEPGATGADEVSFLVRPNRGPAVRPGRRDRVGRRAVARRAGDRGRRRRRDDGLRRDRRGHRRCRPRTRSAALLGSPSARRWSRSRTSRRSRAVADRHFRVEKVPGDPTHTRIEPLDDDERQAELERMLGGRGVPRSVAEPVALGVRHERSSAAAFVEYTGTARLDRRTKHLVRRLGPDDIAIVDHTDLDRVSAEELARVGRARRRQRRPSQTGRFPNPGPLRSCSGGVRLIDAPGADLFDRSRRRLLTVRGASSSATGRSSRRAARSSAASSREALAEQRGARRRRRSRSSPTTRCGTCATRAACSPRASTSRR